VQAFRLAVIVVVELAGDRRVAQNRDMPMWLRRAESVLWSIDAFVFVAAYTALLLLIPTPSPKWRNPSAS
jgi:hypothetical protein